MTLILGYLPSGTGKKEIMALLSRFVTIDKVVFLENKKTKDAEHHCDYECMVKLKLTNRVSGTILANKLNNYCWKGCSIKAHMMLF